MNSILVIYAVVLFFVLTPGILLTLPPKSNKYTVAIVHAVVFGLILYFSHFVVSEGMGPIGRPLCPSYLKWDEKTKSCVKNPY
jgi:hypothetical protein